MTSLAIVPYHHPALHAVARRVETFDLHLAELAHAMDAIRAAAGGVGIAAPQVGQSLRLFIIDDRLPDGSRSARYGKRSVEPLVLANPEIVEESPVRDFDGEGCLSLPDTLGDDGLRYNVPRALNLRYRAQTLDGTPTEGTLNGFMARAFQHELDHLNGLLIDRFRLCEQPAHIG